MGTMMVFSTDEAPDCNRSYETAIKFTLLKPEYHPFTVSIAGEKVYIASSNLQYCARLQRLENGRLTTSRDVFRFATNPWDRCMDGGPQGNVWYDSVATLSDVNGKDSIGYVRVKSRACATNTLPCPDRNYGGWTDLFPWGTSCRGHLSKDSFATQRNPYDTCRSSDIKNPFGFGPTSYDVSDPKPAGWVENGFGVKSGMNRYFDWGYSNPIYGTCEGTKLLEGRRVTVPMGTAYRPGLWRCPTQDEWNYLFQLHRTADGDDSTWTICSIQDTSINAPIAGIILYPDDFSFVGRKRFPLANEKDDPTALVLTIDEWHNLANAGCVFIPSTYYRAGEPGQPRFLQETENKLCWKYWSATSNTYPYVPTTYIFYRDATNCRYIYNYDTKKCLGLPVRLVQDVIQ